MCFFRVQYSVFEGSTFDDTANDVFPMLFLSFLLLLLLYLWDTKTKQKWKERLRRLRWRWALMCVIFYFLFLLVCVCVCVWISDWFTAVWNELWKVNHTVWCGPLVQIQKKKKNTYDWEVKLDQSLSILTLGPLQQ